MILHLNNSRTWRGGEQQLYYLINGLAEKNIPQILIGQPGSELESRIGNKIPFFPIRMLGEYDLLAARKIVKIVKENNVKLIHTHTGAAHGLGLMTKVFLPQLKLVVSRRVDFHINKNPLSKQKYHSQKIDYFLTVSNRIKEVLIEDGVDPEKVVTVYSGIDLTKFAEPGDKKKLLQEFQLSKDTVIIGNVAALVDHKDHETLLRAVPRIQTEKNYIFFIVGAGELESKLKTLTKELGIEDKVIFTGFRNDIKDFYALFDIFTLTSKEEGLGTSVLDAMANKLPIVATNGGGIGEMLQDGKGSLLASVGDYTKLAEHYTRLIDNPTLRTEYGKKNKESVKAFSIENTIQKTILVYNSLL
ncbi:MAG: glycosyltransferase [Leptospiraceae bacterium]|nr:glycosyltransferase [Leptospiraceae bacterium]